MKFIRCKVFCIKSQNVVVKINIRVVFIIKKTFFQLKEKQMKNIQNMCWALFLVCILDRLVFTWAGLIFNVFTSDNNRTIIQISNLILLSRKHFTSFESSLLCSSVSWQKSLLINFLVRLRGQKGAPTRFSSVTSANVGISPQDLMNFTSNPFYTLV